MNRLNFLLAAGVALAMGAADVAAQDRTRGDRGGDRSGYSRGDGHRTGGHRTDGHRGDWNRGDGHRGDRHWGGRWDGHNHHGRHHGGYSWARPYWGASYSWSSPYYWSAPAYWRSYPRWYYDAPLYISYPAYEPPVYVERIIEREPVYVERPVYTQPRESRARSEQSYARAAPEAPRDRIERITLSATELFDFDKAKLRLPQPDLDAVADAMKRNAQIDKVTIVGHTDRLGTDEYNQKLSQQRADAVKAYLVDKGVAAHRLVAVGKGEKEPIVQCDDKDRAKLIDCLEPNRRVEVEQITVETKVGARDEGRRARRQ